ncbi:MAM and LDL-receptor class A domain-containing protein 1 isoform X3 [Cherax quadricarinatus]
MMDPRMTTGPRMLLVVLLTTMIWSTSVFSQSMNDCSFEETEVGVSTCNLLLDASLFCVESWKTGTGSTTSWLGGPPVDARHNPKGGYVFTTTTDMLRSLQQPRRSWLITAPTNTTGPSGRCLQFDYSIGGLGVEWLEVLLVTYHSENINEALKNSSVPLDYQVMPLWRTKQTTHGEWQGAQVTFSTLHEHSLVFSAFPDTHYAKYHGYVAMDDLSFTDGPCQQDCMFDLDLCSWSNSETTDDFDWKIGRSSEKRGTGPSRDQASSLITRITTGGYAYVDSSYPRQPGDVAWLVSATLEPTTEPLCLHFWINMHGGGMGSVRVLQMPLNSPVESKELWRLWKGASWGTDTWYPCQQTVASTEEFQIIFEASVGVPGAGDVGLDTISFSRGACPSLPLSSSPGWGDCTFLDDTCSWQVPSITSSYDCNFLSRVAGNKYNPPGHTESVYEITDMYMKFNLNCYKTHARDRAALVSPVITTSSDLCLSFWVFMYTNIASQIHVGALRVVLQSTEKNTTLWRLQNQQHAGWTYAQVSIPAASSVRVAIEGIQGPKVMGMIGIDDIAFFPLNCKLKPTLATVQVADCTFDHDLCTWELQKTNQTYTSSIDKWQLATGDKILRDHTFDADGGGFGYLESFNTQHTSRLKSSLLPQNQTFCLTFWFSEIYPDHSAKLSLIRLVAGNEEVVWSALQSTITNPPVAVDNDATWRYAQVLLENQDSDYQMIIEGRVTRSAWAIDDLLFIPNREDCRYKGHQTCWVQCLRQAAKFNSREK